MLLQVLVIGVCFSGVLSQSYSPEYCRLLLTRDCSTFPAGQLCGTDSVTYSSLCYLGQAYCKDNNIHQANTGPCKTTPAPVVTTTTVAASTAATTIAPATTTMTSTTGANFVHGSEVVLDIFCLDINYYTCPSGGNRVCGSDGKYYDNMCEFDKARCYHRALHSNGTSCM